ncbi:PEP-CTERM sorting domain-containing protein [Limnoglobus roseus]|uniref:PEP-CTERM sorting domain-containing protein n=1 Tax=Limnoglobus roseus TaxID=2598579 RepID=A0A5C1ACR0_9BACT|nr:PEP-CTERM sorting domain-containing protein [Limnoglobus roseus]QEL15776.1 PEP-CTERM sorting domain-containing protein [Limnoglobus roseus]
MVRFGMALALAVMTVPVASAGPIQWSYQSTWAPIPEPNVTPGLENIIDTGTTIHSTFASTPAGVAEHGAWGWQTVTVGSLVPNADTSPVNYLAQRFQFNLSITDTASGQTGTVSLTGSANETLGFAQRRSPWGDLEDDPRFVNSRHLTSIVLSELSEASLNLGGNEYRVEIVPEYGPDGVGRLDAVVTVGDVNLTPEPSTLASVGLGLLTVAGVRVRRRIS